jgi:hypothetical protein
LLGGDGVAAGCCGWCAGADDDEHYVYAIALRSLAQNA